MSVMRFIPLLSIALRRTILLLRIKVGGLPDLLIWSLPAVTGRPHFHRIWCFGHRPDAATCSFSTSIMPTNRMTTPPKR